jgi:drug/metabolite transporter (DMT)-like permease
MKWSDIGALIALAALWGGSYLCMRLGAGEFGPVALAGVRAAGAALLLMPVVMWRGEAALLRRYWKPIAIVALTNNALPFVLFSTAALSIPAGSSALFTAATPLFTALIAWLWLGDRLTLPRAGGLALGFGGVVLLVWDKLQGGGEHALLASAACIGATVLYGFASNYSKRALSELPPLAVAAGSQFACALMLALPALAAWPAHAPSARAWGAAAMLAIACTALAYVLFFRLIARVGPARTVAVTFLIPPFGMLWGALFLGEAVTAPMLAGCAIILAGTALIQLPARPRPKPSFS